MGNTFMYKSIYVRLFKYNMHIYKLSYFVSWHFNDKLLIIYKFADIYKFAQNCNLSLYWSRNYSRAIALPILSLLDFSVRGQTVHCIKSSELKSAIVTAFDFIDVNKPTNKGKNLFIFIVDLFP